MEEIIHEGHTLQYVKEKKNIQNFMPQDDILISHKIKDGYRKLIYQNSGVYIIKEVNKDYGVYAGNICQVCRKGVLVDYGGCATCPECNAQLKCGL